MTAIRTLEELKRRCIAAGGLIQVRIVSDDGTMSGRQTVQYEPDGFEDEDEDGDPFVFHWDVYDWIDDDRQVLVCDEDLLSETRIGEALARGALFEA